MTVERWDDERLDQLASTVEKSLQDIQTLTTAQSEIAQGMGLLTQTISQFNDRMCALIDIIERIEKQHEALVNSQQRLTETQLGMTQSMERMSEIQERMAQVQERLAHNLASSDAAVERLDRLVDYLIRQDGEREKQSS